MHVVFVFVLGEEGGVVGWDFYGCSYYCCWAGGLRGRDCL